MNISSLSLVFKQVSFIYTSGAYFRAIGKDLFESAFSTSVRTLREEILQCCLIPLADKHQDTRLCFVWPSLDARDNVCYLHEPSLSRFQLFITQKLLCRF